MATSRYLWLSLSFQYYIWYERWTSCSTINQESIFTPLVHKPKTGKGLMVACKNGKYSTVNLKMYTVHKVCQSWAAIIQSHVIHIINGIVIYITMVRQISIWWIMNISLTTLLPATWTLFLKKEFWQTQYHKLNIINLNSLYYSQWRMWQYRYHTLKTLS